MPYDYKETKGPKISNSKSSENKVRIVEKHDLTNLQVKGEKGTVHSPIKEGSNSSSED